MAIIQTRELNRMGIHTQEDRHILVLAIFNGNIKDPRDFVVNFIPSQTNKITIYSLQRKSKYLRAFKVEKTSVCFLDTVNS